MEPTTAIGAAGIATSTIIKVIQHGFTYAEVPDDVRVFQRSIESFNATLGTTKRLRRVKSHLLDDKDKADIDLNIKRAGEILDDISATIEACRKDLSIKGTVSVRNRLLWLIRDHHVFLSRTHHLSICHQNLNCDINGMRLLQEPVQPPAYEAFGFEATLRPPSRRRQASTSSKPPTIILDEVLSSVDEIEPSVFELEDASSVRTMSISSRTYRDGGSSPALSAVWSSSASTVADDYGVDYSIGPAMLAPRRKRRGMMIS